MKSEQWHGAAHLLTVHGVDDDGIQETELDHPWTCKQVELWKNIWDWDCGVTWAIGEIGLPEETEAPGLYLIRDWGEKYYVWDAGWEWDAGLEVLAQQAV